MHKITIINSVKIIGKLKAILFTCFIILFMAGCSTRVTVNPEQAGEIKITPNNLLQPPTDPDKARLYIIRPSRFAGAAIAYTVSIEFNPVLNAKGQPSNANYQDSLGYLANGRSFFVDIAAGAPVAITAKTEGASFILFTPEKSAIYCIEGGVNAGFLVGRPSLVFINDKKCNTLWEKLYAKNKISQNAEYQKKWREKYISNNKPRLNDNSIEYEKTQ